MKGKLILKNSHLMLFAFSSVFYSRIIATTLRLPILNLLHFLVIPLTALIIIFTAKKLNRNQLRVGQSFIIGIMILFVVSLTSAFWNSAGFINAVVSFMMLGEPFMFLLAMNFVVMTPPIFKLIKKYLYISVLINFCLAALQKPLIDSGYLNAGGFNGTDGCGGVFFLSGAGNYVSASVSFTFALYLFSCKGVSRNLKLAVAFAAGWHILFSDSKQLIFSYGFAWLLLILFNSKNIAKTLRFVIGFVLLGGIGLWLVNNIPAFSGFLAWARPELYGSNGDAWYAKFYSVRLINSHFQSDLQWFVGLGPGHSVSRLGAWFLRDYAYLLKPLGATTTVIGQQSMDFVANFWLTSGSSLFSPIFGWVGILGDLGILGLGAYFYLGFLTWRYFAVFDTMKFTLLSIFIIGFIFTQMEEPGFMIFTAFVLGIARKEKEVENEHEALLAQVID